MARERTGHLLSHRLAQGTAVLIPPQKTNFAKPPFRFDIIISQTKLAYAQCTHTYKAIENDQSHINLDTFCECCRSGGHFYRSTLFPDNPADLAASQSRRRSSSAPNKSPVGFEHCSAAWRLLLESPP